MTVQAMLKNKTVRGLLIVIFIWTFFDVLWDLFVSMLHTLMLLAHYLFEFLEHSLDKLVEHVFHTSPRTTEIIVFYIMLVIGGLIAYTILRKIPRWCCAAQECSCKYWQQEKAKAIQFWECQSPILKAKWYTVALSCSYVMYILVLG